MKRVEGKHERTKILVLTYFVVFLSSRLVEEFYYYVIVRQFGGKERVMARRFKRYINSFKKQVPGKLTSSKEGLC